MMWFAGCYTVYSKYTLYSSLRELLKTDSAEFVSVTVYFAPLHAAMMHYALYKSIFT